MTDVTFFNSNGLITGFKICGHTGFSECGSDIVCAALSSASYMTANTITDVLHVDADIKADDDGYMELKLTSKQAALCQDILRGLKLHLFGLSEQYNKFINVKSSEV